MLACDNFNQFDLQISFNAMLSYDYNGIIIQINYYHLSIFTSVKLEHVFIIRDTYN